MINLNPTDERLKQMQDLGQLTLQELRTIIEKGLWDDEEEGEEPELEGWALEWQNEYDRRKAEAEKEKKSLQGLAKILRQTGCISSCQSQIDTTN